MSKNSPLRNPAAQKFTRKYVAEGLGVRKFSEVTASPAVNSCKKAGSQFNHGLIECDSLFVVMRDCYENLEASSNNLKRIGTQHPRSFPANDPGSGPFFRQFA
jgi:hypothetical protein